MWSKYTKKTFCWFPLPKRLKFYLFKKVLPRGSSHSNISFNNTIFALFALGSFFKLLPPTLSAISENNTGSHLILASSLKTKENGRYRSGWHIKSEGLKWFKTRNGGKCFCMQKADTTFFKFNIFIYAFLYFNSIKHYTTRVISVVIRRNYN